MIGEFLKRCRVRLKLKQSDLAELMYCDKQTISNWEREARTPSLDMLEKLSDILNFKVIIEKGEIIMKNNINNNKKVNLNDWINGSYSVVDELCEGSESFNDGECRLCIEDISLFVKGSLVMGTTCIMDDTDLEEAFEELGLNIEYGDLKESSIFDFCVKVNDGDDTVYMPGVRLAEYEGQDELEMDCYVVADFCTDNPRDFDDEKILREILLKYPLSFEAYSLYKEECSYSFFVSLGYNKCKELVNNKLAQLSDNKIIEIIKSKSEVENNSDIKYEIKK